VVSFRPTIGQALARGAYLGGLAGLVAGVGVTVLVAFDLGLAALAVSAGSGALSGLLLRQVEGTDVDDRGVHPVPGGDYAPWQRIADVRTERHGGRTEVTLYLDSGRTARLRAPYSGRLWGSDPAFERKLFMLRHLWATHRNSALGRPM
jgi:hypothetical protein